MRRVHCRRPSPDGGRIARLLSARLRRGVRRTFPRICAARRRGSSALPLALLVCLAGALFLTAAVSRAGYAATGDREKALELLHETVNYVKDSYVTLPDLRKMYAAGLEGLQRSAGKGRVKLVESDPRHFELRSGGARLAIHLGGRDGEGLRAYERAFQFVSRHMAPAPGEKDPELDVMYGGLEGMVGALDPFSAFLRPEAFRQVRVETEGHYGGIGVTISLRGGKLRVISALEDTPAQRAGFEPGDEIVSIDGEPTRGLPLVRIVRLMRGSPGTEVHLLLLRKGWKGPREFVLERAEVRIRSVKSKIFPGGLGYLKISTFNENTVDELDRNLKRLMAARVRGIVLDLRNNPGGLLQKSVQVAERFLPEGSMVVFTRGRQRGQTLSFRTHADGPWSRRPLVVLINQGSASASEIVAGALQDLDRALLIGHTSYGKGSVQTIVPLSYGAGLRLTTAKYYTPLGREIHHKGVHPDVKVDGAQKTAASSAGGPAGAKKAARADEALDLALDVLRETSGADVQALRRAALRVRAKRMEGFSKAEVPSGAPAH